MDAVNEGVTVAECPECAAAITARNGVSVGMQFPVFIESACEHVGDQELTVRAVPSVSTQRMIPGTNLPAVDE